MKSKFSMLAVATLLAVSGSAMADVEGERSTIQFTGEIQNDTCALDSNSSSRLDVDMGKITTNTFNNTLTSTDRPFSITLTGCDSNTFQSLYVIFNGDIRNGQDDVVNVTGPSPADNVGLQILQDGTPVKLDGSAGTDAHTITDGQNSLNFTARYKADSLGGVSGGDANALVNFTMMYQ